MTAQYDGCDGTPPSEKSLRIVIPETGAFMFSAMFAGVGDARHVYATLLDAGGQMKTRQRGATPLTLHLTLVSH